MRGIPIEDDWVPEGLRRTILAGPDGDLTSTDVAPLEIMYGDGTMTSVSRPDEREREAIANGGVVLLSIFGSQHPPVAMGAYSVEEIRNAV